MITIKYLICCETAIIDATTRNITAVNILEEITPSAFPAALSKYSVLSSFRREQGDVDDVEVLLQIFLNDTIVHQANPRIHFGEGKLESRHAALYGGMPLNQPGKLEARISVGDT